MLERISTPRWVSLCTLYGSVIRGINKIYFFYHTLRDQQVCRSLVNMSGFESNGANQMG